MAQRRLFTKIVIIVSLGLSLLILLNMIQGIVWERQGFQRKVTTEIAQSSVTAQKVVGPLLVIPFRETIESVTKEKDTGKSVVETTFSDNALYVLPSKLEINNSVNTQKLSRGIYEALLYTSKISVRGEFSLSETMLKADQQRKIEWKPAYVVLGVSDVRGIGDNPVLVWQDVETRFQPGARSIVKSGIHAPVGQLVGEDGSYEFAFDLTLKGTKQLEFAPVAMNMTVTMQSLWPHPSFIGQYLPAERDVTDDGFTATWRTSHFSTNLAREFVGWSERCPKVLCKILRDYGLGVAFIQPVDIYQQTERAVKYGILFIGLTFAAFFLFEILKQLPIHPIQYGLVGIVLGIFYLLLLSLSEHTGFTMSYVVASVSCVVLLGFYVSYVLRSFLRSLLFVGILSTLYGFLYVLLRLEDYALLMGSVSLFGAVALVMVITRSVDWYQLGGLPVGTTSEDPTST